MAEKIYSYDIWQGKRIEYRILKYGLGGAYQIQYRDPDSYFHTWAWLKYIDIYVSMPCKAASCHEAFAIIDSDVRYRRSKAIGWVPVSCDE